MSEVDECLSLEPVILSFLDNVDAELGTILEAWPANFNNIHVHEVLGGMLARQATLAKEIAKVPPMWNEHTAPIILRAMADVYICIAWLLLDPPSRALRFISFGLGQAKLELEHRRAEMGDRVPTDEEKAMLEARERWIDIQRASFLQDVDLGKWAGLSVREMAEEAGCVDFYNYVYSPLSACAHSMWHHIARFNLIKCANPLHRYHRRPISSVIEPDLHYMLLAGKYWAKTVHTFAKRTEIEIGSASAYDELLAAVTADDPPEHVLKGDVDA